MINAYPINTYIDLDIAQLCFLIKKKRKMFALEKNCVSYKKKNTLAYQILKILNTLCLPH